MKSVVSKGNLVPRQVEGQQDGFEAVLLLHLVVLIRHTQVELAQLSHGAVGLSGHILVDKSDLVEETHGSPSSGGQSSPARRT